MVGWVATVPPSTTDAAAHAVAASVSPSAGAAVTPATPATSAPVTSALVTSSTTTVTVHAGGSTLPGWGFLFLAVLFLAAVAVALPVSIRRTRSGAHRG